MDMRIVSVLLLATLWLTACNAGGGGSDGGGIDGGGGSGCRKDSDCKSGTSCLPPGAPRGCGIPGLCDSQCAMDSDCASMSQPVCSVPRMAPCCPAEQRVRTCIRSCTTGSCAPNERCGAGGGCEPIPCTAGYACPAQTECRIGDARADEHGCTRRACTSDADCAAGTCIYSLCWTGPGTCEPPVP